MIGAIVYELQAENSTCLPIINGRFMHAAFFKILNDVSPKFGTFVHNEFNLKPFTVSFLEPVNEIPSRGDLWIVRRGDKFFWRVTALNKEILQAALNGSVGEKIQAGNLILRINKIICDGNVRADSGVIAIDDFISCAKNFDRVKEIVFEFVSPVSFRIDNFDAPYPRAELIFSSLADKWTQAAMPVAVDKKIIRELTKQIRLTCWSGESKIFYPAHSHGVLAFRGKFSYNVELMSSDIQRVFILLAKFGEFAGVGRLSGQGFGQVSVSYVSADGN